MQELMASVNFVKGKIYEALDNRGMAMDCYVQSLHKSIYMFEALEALVQNEMLMPWEGKIYTTQKAFNIIMSIICLVIFLLKIIY